MPEMGWPCEACGEFDSTACWNPDNLGGHESLVCAGCYRRLLAGENVFPRTIPRPLAATDAGGVGRDG